MNLKWVWSVQTPTAIHVGAPPDICMSLLSKAAHPSIDQLHLRDAFTEGRRYFIETTPDGFRMMTTNKALVSRRRTEPMTVMKAQMFSNGEHSTSIVLGGYLRPIAFLWAFWIPAGMGWLLWPVPWPRMLIVGILTVIFAFAWAGLRYGAALEITEMIYFMHKAFENVPKFVPMALPSPSSSDDANGDFDVLWDQFVRSRQSES